MLDFEIRPFLDHLPQNAPFSPFPTPSPYSIFFFHSFSQNYPLIIITCRIFIRSIELIYGSMLEELIIQFLFLHSSSYVSHPSCSTSFDIFIFGLLFFFWMKRFCALISFLMNWVIFVGNCNSL